MSANPTSGDAWQYPSERYYYAWYEVETPVEVMDPFKNVEFNPEKLGVENLEHVLSTAAVAVGLALRRAVAR